MVTISSLRTALNQPEAHFMHLKALRWDSAPILRSTYFAETRVTIQGVAFLLLMPLSPLSLHRVERFIRHDFHLKSNCIPKLQILRDEMSYLLGDGSTLMCDILLEPLPDAQPFDVELATSGHGDAERFINALTALKRSLSGADISHNNLKEENLMIDGQGKLYPIRWYYATKGEGGDEQAFERIADNIRRTQNYMELHQSDCSAYNASSALDKYLYAGNMHEGLIAVESEAGWGFVNGCCEEVIEPQFLWANDFSEGRAEVLKESGMGLIDKQGNYILDPIYEEVEFDVENGWARVCREQKWALFDYSGRQLCEWGEIEGSKITELIINDLT